MKFFALTSEIQYIYEVQEEQRNLDTNHALAIDLGIDNLATSLQVKADLS